MVPPPTALLGSDREKQQREAAQIILIEELQRFPLIFKGGTALRLVHGNGRFSEDLDFDVAEEMTDRARKNLAKAILDHLAGKEGRWSKDRKVYGDEESFNYYFRAHYKMGSKRARSIKIEISRYKPNKKWSYLPLHESTGASHIKVRVYDLDMLMTGKLNALLTRYSKLTGRRTLQGRDVYDFIRFGKHRKIVWELLDDYQEEVLWFSEKIQEVLQFMRTQATTIYADIEEMLPQEEASRENLISAFIKVLQTLSYPDSEEEEVRKILERAAHGGRISRL